MKQRIIPLSVICALLGLATACGSPTPTTPQPLQTTTVPTTIPTLPPITTQAPPPTTTVTPTTVPTTTRPPTTTPPVTIDAPSTYAANCAPCHGTDRKGIVLGDTIIGPNITPNSAALTTLTATQLSSFITGHSTGTSLTVAQRDALATWLKTTP